MLLHVEQNAETFFPRTLLWFKLNHERGGNVVLIGGRSFRGTDRGEVLFFGCFQIYMYSSCTLQAKTLQAKRHIIWDLGSILRLYSSFFLKKLFRNTDLKIEEQWFKAKEPSMICLNGLVGLFIAYNQPSRWQWKTYMIWQSFNTRWLKPKVGGTNGTSHLRPPKIPCGYRIKGCMY